jgi:hypothetical protein
MPFLLKYRSKQIMKLKFAIFFGLLLIVSCNNSEIELKTKAQNQNTPAVQDKLKQKAAILTELHDEKNCKEFINAFPNNFPEFNLLYGYDDEKGARLLYSKPEHITYFFDCSEVSALEKLKKSIEVGIDGKWDADLIAMFQDGSFNLVKEHTDEAKEILNNLPDEKAASFWYFLFDSPHPNDKQNVRNFELMQITLGKDSKQSRLLAEQFQKLRDSDDGHGR